MTIPYILYGNNGSLDPATYGCFSYQRHDPKNPSFFLRYPKLDGTRSQLFPKHYTILPYKTITYPSYIPYIDGICWYTSRVLSHGYPTFPFEKEHQVKITCMKHLPKKSMKKKWCLKYSLEMFGSTHFLWIISSGGRGEKKAGGLACEGRTSWSCRYSDNKNVCQLKWYLGTFY